MKVNFDKISGIIVTFNEGKNLRFSIESIRWINELIIIDSGSVDDTIGIAEDYTNKIYSINFNGNYSELRKKACNKARHNWIFMLDADERLPEGAQKVIRKLVKAKDVDGYWFPRKQYINDRQYLSHGYFYPDLQLRLFRNNGKIKYSGVIHEQPVIPKEKTRIIKDLQIIHNPSHTKYDSFFHFSRFFNYIAIEGKDLAKKNVSSLSLFGDMWAEFFRHTYRSFIKLHGYKDGYAGLRAAVIYALYRSSVRAYAFFIRLRGNV